MTKQLILSFIFLAGLGTAGFAQGIAGDWTGVIHGQNGNDFNLSYHFKVAGDSLSGTMDSPRGGDPMPINNGRVASDSLFFDMDFNGALIHYSGKMVGDSLDLTRVRADGTIREMMLGRAAAK